MSPKAFWSCENISFDNSSNADLVFEYSNVEADIIGSIDSIKNPMSGYINADNIGQIILENNVYKCDCKINTK